MVFSAFYTDGRPVSKTLCNTAAATSFLDDLFDSVNGSKTIKYIKEKSKVLRTAVTANSGHEEFWRKAINTIEKIRFIDKNNRQGSVPSIINWITTLKSYLRVWQFLRSKDINLLRPRYFNSDPIENFFGQVRAYNCRYINPDCHAFTNTFKALLITGIIKYHSNNFNCEKASANPILKVTQLFQKTEIAGAAVSADDNTVSVLSSAETTALNPLSENILESAIREKISVHSKAYTVGWVIRKIFSKREKCGDCLKSLTSKELNAVHNWIESREYKTKKQKKLTYPSVHVVRMFGNILKESNEYLEINAHKSKIKNNLKDILKTKYSFDFLTCQDHRTVLIEYLLEISLKLCIFNWCNRINKILKGTDIIRLEKQSFIPPMQRKALQKYKKKMKKKI